MLSSALKQCLCSCCILGPKFWSHSEEEESQQTWELTLENHLLSHQAMKYFFDFFDANIEKRSPYNALLTVSSQLYEMVAYPALS